VVGAARDARAGTFREQEDERSETAAGCPPATAGGALKRAARTADGEGFIPLVPGSAMVVVATVQASCAVPAEDNDSRIVVTEEVGSTRQTYGEPRAIGITGIVSTLHGYSQCCAVAGESCMQPFARLQRLPSFLRLQAYAREFANRADTSSPL